MIPSWLTTRFVYVMLLVTLVALVGTVSATVFTWTLSGIWGDQNHWDPDLFSCDPNCFPNSSNDEAVFTTQFSVELDANRTIDAMYVSDADVNGSSFVDTDVDDPATLTCDYIEIINTTRLTVVTLIDKATVIVTGP